jgi:hypothetical protein
VTATTIGGLLTAIEAALGAIDGLRVAGYVADQINPPQAIVGVPPIPAYRQTFGRGIFRMEPTVTVLVSAALDRVGQLALAEYADVTGGKSIPAAIEADMTLGGIVASCTVTSFRPLGLKDVGVIGFYGGVFSLLVTAKGV